jgi:hypothetical protein
MMVAYKEALFMDFVCCIEWTMNAMIEIFNHGINRKISGYNWPRFDSSFPKNIEDWGTVTPFRQNNGKTEP